MLDTTKCIDCDYVSFACPPDYGPHITICGFDPLNPVPLETITRSLVLCCPLGEDLTPIDNTKGEKMNVVEKIGEAALLEQAAEECTELAKELLKMARKLRNENPTPTKLKTIKKHLWEETADVLLCLDMLDDAGFIPQEEVMGIYREKEARMNKRLNIDIHTDNENKMGEE